ncbi:LOW QUALITY PROTEIN: hypothetical protein YC2023_101884 [Brassica napus]
MGALQSLVGETTTEETDDDAEELERERIRRDITTQERHKSKKNNPTRSEKSSLSSTFTRSHHRRGRPTPPRRNSRPSHLPQTRRTVSEAQPTAPSKTTEKRKISEAEQRTKRKGRGGRSRRPRTPPRAECFFGGERLENEEKERTYLTGSFYGSSYSLACSSVSLSRCLSGFIFYGVKKCPSTLLLRSISVVIIKRLDLDQISYCWERQMGPRSCSSYDIIDSALLRPGRFDQLIYIPLPDEDSVSISSRLA